MPLTDIDGQRLGDSVADKLGNRNLVINGNFRIDQRNGGASITTSAGNNFPVDRWLLYDNAGSDFTSEQDTDAPTGHDYSLLVTSAAATSPGSNDYYFVCQRIEGNNVAHLDFGSSDAETVTISFYVKSSLTGTFSGALGNSSFNRAYPFTYTISSANTWEQKTVTIAGDTAGTWATDNTTGLQVLWDLGSGTNRVGTAGAWVGSDHRGVTGSTQIVATSGATFRLAGVQVEVGNTATPFEHRSYADELVRCERYYQTSAPRYMAGQFLISNEVCSQFIPFKPEMRATPSPTYGTLSFRENNGNFTTSTLTGNATLDKNGLNIVMSVSGAATSDSFALFMNDGEFDAEL